MHCSCRNLGLLKAASRHGCLRLPSCSSRNRPLALHASIEINHLAVLRLHGAQRLDESLLLLLVQFIDVLVVLLVLAIIRNDRDVVGVPGRNEALRHRRRAVPAVALL